MNTPDPTRKTRSAWLRVLIAFALLFPILVVLIGSPYVWALDLATPGLWYLWFVAVVPTLLIYTRWRDHSVLVCFLIALICALPMISSRDWVRARDIQSMDTDDVTILLFNSKMGNPTQGEVARFVSEQDTDIVVVPEPVWEFYIKVQRRQILIDQYPYFYVRPREDTVDLILVLSKWPMSHFENEPLANINGMVCRVHRPDEQGGGFVVVAGHPHSPRNPTRWEEGNEAVRRIAERINTLQDDGHRTLLAADLNATPGSYRDRVLRSRTDTKRAKPILGAWGSFPADWVIGRLAIDDVWYPPEMRVRSWKTLAGPGSDHLALRLVVSIPEDPKTNTR